MYPIFILSIVLFKFFFQNCIAVLSINKTDNSRFLGLTHTMALLNINLLILTLFWLKTSVKLSKSNWSSETQSVIPCLSQLLRLLYWSYYVKSVFNTEIRLSHFSIFWWGNEFSSRSASMMDSLTLERLEATKS